MKQIADLPSDQRAEVFNEAGLQLGLPPYYVEKDFWVCWVLQLLFGHDQMGQHLTFRGGTSLSKGWQLIERFSEDVDLAMSREWVDPELPNPAEEGINNAERDRRLRQLRHACRQTIRNELVPLLEAAAAELGQGARINVIDLDRARDPFVIELEYPKSGFEVPGNYHREVVKIELSGRADDWPQEDRPISPFVAEAFPQLGPWTPMAIACVTPARTFWEKAALLHERYAQGNEVALGARQARHLYDLVRLWELVKDDDGLVDLFDGVKLHRKTFFNYGRVDYDNLLPGDLLLVPPDDQMAGWRNDYQAMRLMFIGEPPTFESLLESIKGIESELRACH
jgi:hypothetical protein